METITDRRLIDRRKAVPFLSRYQFVTSGRRHHSRRDVEQGSAYVDRYHPVVILCALAVVTMSAFDAAFTLRLLQAGAVELNVMMAVLIEDDVRKFIAFKLALTSLAVMLLVIHHKVRIGPGIKVLHIQYLALVGYAALIGYELTLLRVVLW